MSQFCFGSGGHFLEGHPSPYHAKGKQSEQRKRRLRQDCRERLADHIKKQTDLTVAPGRVRLTTRPSDGYTWTYRSEVAHLFSKHLSMHKVEACKELCREVGNKFWAVPFTEAKQPSLLPPPSSQTLLSTSPSVKNLVDLDRDGELSLLKVNLKVETAEKERLRADLAEANNELERLAKRLQEMSRKADQYQSLAFNCLAVMGRIRSSIDETQNEYVDTVDFDFFPS
ncbi:hypothetical protein BGZ63DRAFT_482908 [Mariannaea sp. PMI_226]|nr:hypothetical protein BGZ63DRAFT_482908 [Mariannaea sp. PMI_226]